jgi:hypothetical protein
MSPKSTGIQGELGITLGMMNDVHSYTLIYWALVTVVLHMNKLAHSLCFYRHHHQLDLNCHRSVDHVHHKNDDNVIIAQYIGITGNGKVDEIPSRSLWNSRKCSK